MKQQPNFQYICDELQKLSATIEQAAPRLDNDLERLALIKVFQGMTLEKWRQTATADLLQSWLALPLDESHTEAVSQLMKHYEWLVRQQDQDPLTKIGNRRLFDNKYSEEFVRAIRSKTDLSLAILDLDNFKKVNDTYGHLCGDIVLQKLALHLATQFRSYDTACRIGGEEFAILLPNTNYLVASHLCNRLLSSFRKIPFCCDDKNTFYVTFSVGIASVFLLGPEGLDTEILFKAADDAMYSAKRAGKNRVETAITKEAEIDRQSLVEQAEKKLLFYTPDLEHLS